MFDQADVVLLQLEIPMETVEKSIIMAQKAGAQIILNPAPAAKIKEEYLKKIDFLTPNESEARLLAESNDTDPEKLAAQLSAYAKNVIMTLGSKGVYCHTKDFSDYIAGFKVEAMDTTAAGDVFNGALAVGLCEKDSVQEAIHFANAAAALSVMKMGAQSSVPSRQDIDRFVEMNLHR
jgi:ribokinase